MALGWDDIDPRVRAALADQGIQKLYPPQEAALDAALAGRNLLLAIPTASGKSLVAYLAILHRHLQGRPPQKALYIVPLRALATEKYEDLKAFQKPLGLRVGLATGDLDDEDDRLGRFDVVVATSEKADSLLRHRAGWMHDVRIVVADEVHLMTDPGRGPTLEVLLARFKGFHDDLQILGLSATVKNAKQLAAWLQADLVESEWRPTKLKKGVAYGRGIDFGADGTRPIVSDAGDPVADLVLDMIDEGGQSLVFLSTRRSAESLARKLGTFVRGRLTEAERAKLQALSRAVADDEDLAELPGEALPPADGAPVAPKADAHTLGGKLAQCVLHGSAFHNAGLTGAQRRLVERNFREGLLKVLCATPTLAAGVNTPARRVVIRDTLRFDANLGNQPIPVLEVQQMMGRAGRPRYDPYGEAILVAKTKDDKDRLVESYIDADPEPITSKLGTESALRVHVLASVASGSARSVGDVERFLDSTFYAHQGEAWLIKAQLQQVLRFLEANDFLTRAGDRLEATPFGRRTSDLYIDPLSALILRQAIERAALRRDVSDFAFLHAITSTPDVDALFLRQRDEWVVRLLARVEDVDPLALRTLGSFADFAAMYTRKPSMHDVPLAHRREPALAEVTKLLVQRHGVPPERAGPDASLEALGLDERARTEFFDAVCERFEIEQLKDRLLFAPHEAQSHEVFLSTLKTANLLHQWIEETPMRELEVRYGIGPGDVRNKVDRAEWLAHAARELARLLHFETATALNDLPLRLRHGARKEVLPLIKLDGVGRVRARRLFAAGYTSLGALRKARPQALADVDGIGPVLAQSIKRQLGDEEGPQELGLREFR